MAMEPATMAVVAAVAGKLRPDESLRDILCNVFGLSDASMLFKPDPLSSLPGFPPAEWLYNWSTEEERLEWMKTGRWLSYRTVTACG